MAIVVLFPIFNVLLFTITHKVSESMKPHDQKYKTWDPKEKTLSQPIMKSNPVIPPWRKSHF